MRKYVKTKNLVLHAMKEIYYPNRTNNLDWMGYLITEANKPTYHHIIKACELRRDSLSSIATLDNGAYLGKLSHEQLHRIENEDIELYNAWNSLFRIINDSKTYISDELWKEIFTLQTITKKIDKEVKVKKLVR